MILYKLSCLSELFRMRNAIAKRFLSSFQGITFWALEIPHGR
jgi:hypothetical protein